MSLKQDPEIQGPTTPAAIRAEIATTLAQWNAEVEVMQQRLSHIATRSPQPIGTHYGPITDPAERAMATAIIAQYEKEIDETAEAAQLGLVGLAAVASHEAIIARTVSAANSALTLESRSQQTSST